MDVYDLFPMDWYNLKWDDYWNRIPISNDPEDSDKYPGKMATPANNQIFLIAYIMVHIVQLVFAVLGDRMTIFFMMPCPIASATCVLVTEKSTEQAEGDSELNSTFSRVIKSVRKRLNIHTDIRSTLHPVKTFTNNGGTSRYFEFTCIRYIWSDVFQRFKPYRPPAPSGTGAIKSKDKGGLTTQEVEEQHCFCGPNEMNVPVPTILDALTAEFTTAIVVIQMMTIWVYFIFDSWNISVLWLAMVEEKSGKYFGYLARCENKFCI